MKTYIEPEEVALMEQAASNLRDKLLVRILLKLRCRVSEALSTSVDDIDFNKSTIIITQLRRHIKLCYSICAATLRKKDRFCSNCGTKIEQKKTEEQEHRQQRVLPVDDDTLEMLHEYIERGGPVANQEQRLLFNIKRHRSWQIVKECSQRAGLR